MAEESSTIVATLITEDGDLIPIRVYVLEGSEAVAFPLVDDDEAEQETAVKATRPVYLGSFTLEDQQVDAAVEWVGQQLRFPSFEAYGRAFIEEIARGYLRVRVPNPVLNNAQQLLSIQVPGFQSVPIYARPVAHTSGHVRLQLLARGASIAQLAPEQLRAAAATVSPAS